MGWRFRKSFSPLPGVRLTLSPRGLTTSVGAGPFRMTLGSRGAALTSRLPGTGISLRTPIHAPHIASAPDFGSSPALLPDAPSPTPSPLVPGQGEIRSGGTSEMTSPGLAGFRELVAKAQKERQVLIPELAAASAAAVKLAKKRERWGRNWFVQHFMRGRFARVEAEEEEARARFEELTEQESLSKLQTHIDLPDPARQTFSRLCDDFSVLSKSTRIWDTVSRIDTNRFVERTTASQSVDRRPVHFALGGCNLLQSEWSVPYLANANGGEIFIYPGFVLYHVSAEAFAVIDLADVDIQFKSWSFIE